MFFKRGLCKITKFDAFLSTRPESVICDKLDGA